MSKHTKSSKRKHHVVLLLDRSGSMASYVDVTIKGVNEMLATARNIEKESGEEVVISLFGFEYNGELIPGYDAVPASKVKNVSRNEVWGRGGTHMYDGMGFVFSHLTDKLGSRDTLLFATFTDGDTGGDSIQPSIIKSIVEKSHEKGHTFALLKPTRMYGRSSSQSGSLIGVPESNVMEYEYNQSGFRNAFYKLSRGLRKYLEAQVGNGIARIDGFFDGVEPKNPTMKVNGLEVSLNMPESLRSDEEMASGELPGYAPVDAYVVDEYPACPTNWMNGSAKASSYFVPVKENHGMWLDFNKLGQDEHDIAVVISVQGVNPITGQKTSAMRLEKYENKCPVHDKEFGQERFCKDCGYKWPSQNYISTNATPNGQLWLDGFRDGDGKVRQYVFTAEQARSVAKAIIGDDRVFAIGLAFFKSKEKKAPVYTPNYKTREVLTSSLRQTFSMNSGPELRHMAVLGDTDGSVKMSLRARAGGLSVGGRGAKQYKDISKGGVDRDATKTCAVQDSGLDMMVDLESIAHDPNQVIVTHHAISCSVDGLQDQACYSAAPAAMDMFATPSFVTEKQIEAVKTKSYEVGHGGKIDQQVYPDSQKMEYWQEEPFAMVYVNYADEDSVKKILAAGKRKEVQSGFLANIPAGK